MLIRHRQPIKRLGKSSHNRPHNLGKDAPWGHHRNAPFSPQPVRRWKTAVFSTSTACVSPGDHSCNNSKRQGLHRFVPFSPGPTTTVVGFIFLEILRTEQPKRGCEHSAHCASFNPVKRWGTSPAHSGTQRDESGLFPVRTQCRVATGQSGCRDTPHPSGSGQCAPNG